MGEHNDWVLREMLGLPKEEVAGLEEAGVIGYSRTIPAQYNARRWTNRSGKAGC